MSYCPSFSENEISRFHPVSEEEADDVEGSGTFLKFSAKNVKNEKLSVLIVSAQNFCDRLKGFMSEIITQKYNGNIFVKFAESVEQILESAISYTTIDYIVLVFNTTRMNNVKQLKNEMLQIESSYVAARRLCFVNGSPKDGVKGTDLEIAELAQQYNLLHLNGQVMNNDSCKRLCERILELVITSCGLIGGAPFIIPTALDIFRSLYT